MNHLIVVALGGAVGAVFRFLISTGVYQWLGRGFPYGTLTVNVIGSFLIGLMTEALLLQRISLALEYRSAILVGLFGSLTTFSTFSLETLYLLEQGNFAKAGMNVLISVFICIFAVWVGLNLGRSLFLYSAGTIRWMGWVFPYALLMVNAMVAFLISFVSTLLLNKIPQTIEHSVALPIVLVGVFITLSSLYLVLYFIEHGYAVELHVKSIAGAIACNIAVSGLTIWLGYLSAKQL